jgi:hypothetical protein
MVDVMDRGSIDAIAHRAVSAAQRTADARALPELRTTPRRWRTPAIAIATVAVIIVGLTVIVDQRSEPVAETPASLEWLLRDVPNGWRPVLTRDPSSPPLKIESQPFSPNVYATDSSPLGPNLAVYGSTDADFGVTPGAFSANALGYTEFDLDGRRAAFVDLRDGDRGLYVEIDGAWAYLAATDVSDDDLLALARSIGPDLTGRFDIDPATLTNGMRKISPLPDPLPAFASIDYQPPAGSDGLMQFSVGRNTPGFYGRSSVGYRFEEIAVGDSTGYIAGDWVDNEADRSWIVLWQNDGLDFALYATDFTREQAVAAARSASPATEAEWAQLADSADVAPSDTVVTGTAPPQILDVEPVDTVEPRDVDITVSVTNPSDNEQRWTGTLPTGEIWTAVVLRVFDRIETRITIDGVLTETSSGSPLPKATDSSEVTCCSPQAITTNPDAASLRVLRPNGDRYTIPLQSLPGTSDTRIALIGLPEGAVLTELLDEDGNVLQEYVTG